MVDFQKVLATLRSDASSAAVFVTTVVITLTLFYYLNRDPKLPTKPPKDPEPPRNFTLAQLRVSMQAVNSLVCRRRSRFTILHSLLMQEFTGKEEDQPIYLALQGEVYDVSQARDFYGPEGCYGTFAGHDVTKAFALNSLEEKDLDDPKYVTATHCPVVVVTRRDTQKTPASYFVD